MWCHHCKSCLCNCLIAHSVIIQSEVFFCPMSHFWIRKGSPCLYAMVDKETWLSDSTRQDNPLALSPWKEYSHTLYKESIRCETSSWQLGWFYVENCLHCGQYNITTLVTFCFKCQRQYMIVNHTMKIVHHENKSRQSAWPDLKKEDFFVPKYTCTVLQ